MSSSDSSEASPPPRNSANQYEDSDSSLGLSSLSSTSTNDNRELLEYDPTPDNPYPQPYWFSCRQVMSREYGKNIKPGLLNKRSHFVPYSPYWFNKYAYNSLYFIQRMEMSDILESHSGCVNCLNFNTTGNLLCSGSDDLLINIWDWQSAKLKHSFSSGHTQNIFHTRWCLGDSQIVTCARDCQVRICDINNSGSSKRIAQHSGPVHKCTFSDPQVVLTCGEDGVICEIDLRCDRENILFTLRDHRRRPTPLYSIHCNMAFTPHYFAVSGQSTNVSIFDRRFISNPSSGDSSPDSSDSSSSDSSSVIEWDTPRPAAVMELCARENRNTIHTVTSAIYNSTGSKILASYNDDDLYVFDIKSGREEGKYQGHRNSATIKGCSWYTDDFILSGSDDGFIYGWDRKSQHIIMSVQADHAGAVNCLEMHPRFPVIASSGIEDSIKIWEPTSDSWPKTLTGIKKRICGNIKERQQDAKHFSFDTGGLAIWLVMRDIRQQIGGHRNQEDNDSGSQEEEDTSTDGSCLPS